jgi:K+-transporting ATPase KdpF subunit
LIYGCDSPGLSCSVLLGNARSHDTLSETNEWLNGERTMNWMYILGGTIAVFLLVYLLTALLKPEMFE